MYVYSIDYSRLIYYPIGMLAIVYKVTRDTHVEHMNYPIMIC